MDHNSNNGKKKSSSGRQKIEIKRIENQARRQVSFTKRRQGVIKKASDLSVLCGAEVAILAFSPAGKPFSFGQPSVDAVVSRFLSSSRAPAASLGGSTRSGGMAAECLNVRYMAIEQQLEAEREKKASAEERLRAAVSAVGVMERALTEKDMEGLGLAGLEAAKRVMEEVRLRVEARQKEMLAVVPRPMSGAVAARPISMVTPPDAIAGGGMATTVAVWRRQRR